MKPLTRSELENAKNSGLTDYSHKIGGDQGNYNWAVRFDFEANGYLGITQLDGDTHHGRVLLNKKQTKELLDFIQLQKIKFRL